VADNYLHDTLTTPLDNRFCGSTSKPSGVGPRGTELPGRLRPTEDLGAEPCDAPPSGFTAPPSGLPTSPVSRTGFVCDPGDQSEGGKQLAGELGSAPRAAGESGPRHIGHRIDALVVAYRVQLSEEARGELRRAAGVALRHGRSELRLLIPGKTGSHDTDFCVCEVRAQKGERLNFENADLRGVFLETLAMDEPGWSLELVARAVYLACHSLDDVVQELRTWAAAFGRVFEERLRRVDLCADFERFPIAAPDGDAFVRPPRSTMTSWTEGRKPDAKWHKTYRMAGQIVTGHTICPANALMLRVYDKTQELRVHRDPVKEHVERVIWAEHGWTGEQVTRIEFQIRGEAAKELLGRQVDRLRRELPALWRYCSERWVRLVVPDAATRLRRCPLDPRWQAVQAVDWGPKQDPSVRTRHRGMATALQAWGTMLTAMGQAEALTDEMTDQRGELRTTAARSDAHAQGAVSEIVRELLEGFGELAESALLTRSEGSYLETLDFIVERARAAQARATQEHRTDEGDDTNGPHGKHCMDERPPSPNRPRLGLDGSSVQPAPTRPTRDQERAPQERNHGRGGDDGPMVLDCPERENRNDALLARILARGNRASKQAEDVRT